MGSKAFNTHPSLLIEDVSVLLALENLVIEDDFLRLFFGLSSCEMCAKEVRRTKDTRLVSIRLLATELAESPFTSQTTST